MDRGSRSEVAAQAVQIDGTPAARCLPSPSTCSLFGASGARRLRSGPEPRHEDATGRDARDLVRELRDALSAGRSNHSDLRNWIVARRSLGAFELALEREEIEVGP